MSGKGANTETKLTPQERRCISLVCDMLSQRFGGDWKVPDGPTLAAGSRVGPTPRTPETIVGNGVLSAAVEVKSLTGDSEWQTYRSRHSSLERALAPSCGGRYRLNGSVDLRLSLEKPFIRTLRKEIERVAPLLEIGDTGLVRIPRSAKLRISTSRHEAILFCSHADPTIRSLATQLPDGFIYWLVDDGDLEHEIHSEAAREEFVQAIQRAVGPMPCSRDVLVNWHEEWQLERVETNGRPAGVWVVAATDAFDVSWSIDENVRRMLNSGLRKFESKRWADLHVLAFDKNWPLMDSERLRELLATLEVEDERVWPVESIILVDGEVATEVWYRDQS